MTYWQYLMKVGRKKKEEDRKVLLKLLLTRAKNRCFNEFCQISIGFKDRIFEELAFILFTKWFPFGQKILLFRTQTAC